ncbi:MAG: hypothetical protein AAGA87_17675 [Pseudomonadota bacterium]
MPPLIRLMIVNALIGYGAAAGFVALLFAFNVANLWHLVSTSDVGLLAAFLLWFFNGIVFGGVQMSIAVMRLAENPDDDPPGPRPNLPALATIPLVPRHRT